MKALYGPMDTFNEVRMFSTDVLGQPPIFFTKERERFQLSFPLFLW